MRRLSIIIPTLDEGEAIAGALDALTDLRQLGTEIGRASCRERV